MTAGVIIFLILVIVVAINYFRQSKKNDALMEIDKEWDEVNTNSPHIIGTITRDNINRTTLKELIDLSELYPGSVIRITPCVGLEWTTTKHFIEPFDYSMCILKIELIETKL